MKRLWLLNLGAELELEGREHSHAARRRSKDAAKTLAETLVPGSDDWFVDPAGVTMKDGRREGRAFLPTPNALRILRAAGADIEAPGVSVLRQANSRSFSVAHFPRPDVYLLREESELRSSGQQLLKRDLSFAGGGQRRISQDVDDSDRAWVRASLIRGPVCVEPWRHIEEEVGVPGFVHRDGRIDVGSPVEQVVVRGQWRESRVGNSDPPGLRDTCREAGQHLAELGYFGPFNIDAHRSKEHGWTHVSEINARYTMGWALGWLSRRRPDLS
ncbi:MAG: hypothetical protein ACI9KE_001504 [Polyangiales bacterium]